LTEAGKPAAESHPGSGCPTPSRYRLSVEARGVTIVAGDVLGLHYGVTSFIQLVRLCKASPAAVGAAADPEDTAAAASARPGMPPVTIIDQPALLTRGYMLDVSRNKGRFSVAALDALSSEPHR
jgi:N-acetyl-beta-hexosaminidase